MTTLRKQLNRVRTKIGRFDNGQYPSVDKMQRLLLLHGLDKDRLVLEGSENKVTKTVQGLSRKFPLLSKAIFRRSEPEQKFFISEVTRLGPERMERAIKAGLKIDDLKLVAGSDADLVIKYATPKNTQFIQSFGYNLSTSRQMTILLNFFPKEIISQVLPKIKQSRMPFGIADMVQLMHYYKIQPKRALLFLELVPKMIKFDLRSITHKISFFESLFKKYTSDEIIRKFSNKHVYAGNKEGEFLVRKNHLDIRRVGKPLFIFRPDLNNAEFIKRMKMSGIDLFEHKVVMKKLTSAARKRSNRYTFYIDVPEIKELRRLAKPMREHLKGVLGFSDVEINLEKNHGRESVLIQEIQSDFFFDLPKELQTKYGSWEKILILSIAKVSKQHGYKNLLLSSPDILKNMWDSLPKSVTERTYLSVAKEMGFNPLIHRKGAYMQDYAFGKLYLGHSNVLNMVPIAELEKKYPAFFEQP